MHQFFGAVGKLLSDTCGGVGRGGGRGGVVDTFMVGRYITFHNCSYHPVLLEPALNVLESLQVPFNRL